MRFSTPLFFASFSLLTTALTISACSSSSSTADSGCASAPFSCAAGQTCSPKDNAGGFACFAAGTAKKGEACVNIVGSAPCGEGLVCLQITAAGPRCETYCEQGNAAHGCATGETCSEGAVNGSSTHLFICSGGTAPAADAGTGTDAATATDAAGE